MISGLEAEMPLVPRFCVRNGCSAPVLLCKEGDNILFVDACFLVGPHD
jgi:hypothetical protein